MRTALKSAALTFGCLLTAALQPEIAFADNATGDAPSEALDDGDSNEVIVDPSQSYRIYRTTRCSGSKCGNGRQSRRESRRHRRSHVDDFTGPSIGAEGTPNIPGAAGTPNIPGAGGTPVVPGASTIRR